MVSLLKNQILKRLSRYTKNLSTDKINLSTFKGEGELSSLELDEIVLTDLLDLPSWIRLKSAWCNKVSFRIQLRKLNKFSIKIHLDEVKVEIETCDELRSLSPHQANSTSYNFINEAIDGITIHVNVVYITFNSPAFTASVQIMRIVVESKSPYWTTEELEKTRIKDEKKEQLLIFKALEWQSVRLEAISVTDSDLPPLRLLITKKSVCRLTIKKRLSDGFVMGCRLLLMLEDLLWVLTDSQLKAVLYFAESLSGLIQKANETTRIKKAARKLEMLPEYQAQVSQQARGTSEPTTPREMLFSEFDVVETSYHLIARKINLHLIDDPGVGRSMHPLLGNGSIVDFKVSSLQVDYYPYHLAAADRSRWAKYNQANSPHVHWLTSAQNKFKNSLLKLIDTSNKSTPTNKPNRGFQNTHELTNSESSPTGSCSVKKYVTTNLAKVMTSCIVLRVDDFTVTTNNKQIQKEFIKGDRDRHTFPTDVTLHAEFTYFYYPGDIAFPLPAPKFYVHINPVVLNFDAPTILWFNSFALNLHQSLLDPIPEGSSSASNYFDVKIEAIMPRLVFEGSKEHLCGQRDRPKSLQIQVSRALISNVRSSDGCSRVDLAKCINACQLGSLFLGTNFPVRENDFNVISDKFIDHVQCKDNVRPSVEELPTSSVAELVTKLSKTLLWTEARDVWCINLEPVWAEFYGARGVASNRPVPFLDAFPLKLWVHIDPQAVDTPQIHGIAYISNLISVQINHYQMLFLLRLADELTEVITILNMDSQRITLKETGAVVMGAVIPQVEVTLVMPSLTPGKESSGADLESVIPDTSSLNDDVVVNPSIQWNSVISTNLRDGVAYKRESTLSASSPPNDQLRNFETTDFTRNRPIEERGRSESDMPSWLPTEMSKLMSVKKGLTNFTSNILETSLKNDESIELTSSRSDGSSCSDNYIEKLSRFGDPMFEFENGDPLDDEIDCGSEALEECDDHSGATLSVTTPSENPSNASYFKRRDLISVATVKLGQVEVAQQSEGNESSIKAHVSSVAIEECTAIPWDEFQNKFNARSRGWTEVCDHPTDKPRIRLRLDHKVKVGDCKTWPGPKTSSWFEDLLTLAVSNINLSVNAQTLSSIAEFFVDDVVTPPLPMQVEMENMELNLIDERGPGPNNPINVNISKLHITRNKDGVISVEPPPLNSPQGTPVTSKEVTDLKLEVEQLKRKLVAMERLNEENHRLRKCEEEAQELRSCLNEAQDSLNSLLVEKQDLLELVRSVQISKTEGKQQSSSKR